MFGEFQQAYDDDMPSRRLQALRERNAAGKMDMWRLVLEANAGRMG